MNKKIIFFEKFLKIPIFSVFCLFSIPDCQKTKRAREISSSNVFLFWVALSNGVLKVGVCWLNSKIEGVCWGVLRRKNDKNPFSEKNNRNYFFWVTNSESPWSFVFKSKLDFFADHSYLKHTRVCCFLIFRGCANYDEPICSEQKKLKKPYKTTFISK